MNTQHEILTLRRRLKFGMGVLAQCQYMMLRVHEHSDERHRWQHELEALLVMLNGPAPSDAMLARLVRQEEDELTALGGSEVLDRVPAVVTDDYAGPDRRSPPEVSPSEVQALKTALYGLTKDVSRLISGLGESLRQVGEAGIDTQKAGEP